MLIILSASVLFLLLVHRVFWPQFMGEFSHAYCHHCGAARRSMGTNSQQLAAKATLIATTVLKPSRPCNFAASNSHPPNASDADPAKLVSAITIANTVAAALGGMMRAVRSN